MFGQERLTALHARKELLLAQAEAHRALLVHEAQVAARSLHWLEPIHRGWQRVKSFAWLVAPVAGFCVVRRGRSIVRLGMRLLRAWHWFAG
jgi:hypothetical protein